MDNSKWIEALKVRTTDKGWLGPILIFFSFGILGIFHSIQRRTLTLAAYLLIYLFIINPILNIPRSSCTPSAIYSDEWICFYFGGDLVEIYLHSLYYPISIIFAFLLIKLAIRHDRLVALKLLKDKKIKEKTFSLTELIQMSLKFFVDDFIKFVTRIKNLRKK